MFIKLRLLSKKLYPGPRHMVTNWRQEQESNVSIFMLALSPQFDCGLVEIKVSYITIYIFIAFFSTAVQTTLYIQQ